MIAAHAGHQQVGGCSGALASSSDGATPARPAMEVDAWIWRRETIGMSKSLQNVSGREWPARAARCHRPRSKRRVGSGLRRSGEVLEGGREGTGRCLNAGPMAMRRSPRTPTGSESRPPRPARRAHMPGRCSRCRHGRHRHASDRKPRRAHQGRAHSRHRNARCQSRRYRPTRHALASGSRKQESATARAIGMRSKPLRTSPSAVDVGPDSP